MDYVVYWLHKSEDTDIKTEGYVGITNDLSRRIKNHRDKNLLYSVVNFGSKYYCKGIEYGLRPDRNIGLNVAQGGGGGNAGMLGKNHKEETKRKMRKPHKPYPKEHGQKISKAMMGNTRGRGNKGRDYSWMIGNTYARKVAI